MNIAKTLQDFRKQADLSQSQLAQQAGITQAMVSKVESGKDVRLSTLIAIINALQLNLVVVTQQENVQLRQMRDNSKRPKTLLERFEVKDDE